MIPFYLRNAFQSDDQRKAFFARKGGATRGDGSGQVGTAAELGLNSNQVMGGTQQPGENWIAGSPELDAAIREGNIQNPEMVIAQLQQQQSALEAQQAALQSANQQARRQSATALVSTGVRRVEEMQESLWSRLPERLIKTDYSGHGDPERTADLGGESKEVHRDYSQDYYNAVQAEKPAKRKRARIGLDGSIAEQAVRAQSERLRAQAQARGYYPNRRTFASLLTNAWVAQPKPTAASRAPARKPFQWPAGLNVSGNLYDYMKGMMALGQYNGLSGQSLIDFLKTKYAEESAIYSSNSTATPQPVQAPGEVHQAPNPAEEILSTPSPPVQTARARGPMTPAQLRAMFAKRGGGFRNRAPAILMLNVMTGAQRRAMWAKKKGAAGSSSASATPAPPPPPAPGSSALSSTIQAGRVNNPSGISAQIAAKSSKISEQIAALQAQAARQAAARNNPADRNAPEPAPDRNGPVPRDPRPNPIPNLPRDPRNPGRMDPRDPRYNDPQAGGYAPPGTPNSHTDAPRPTPNNLPVDPGMLRRDLPRGQGIPRGPLDPGGSGGPVLSMPGGWGTNDFTPENPRQAGDLKTPISYEEAIMLEQGAVWRPQLPVSEAKLRAEWKRDHPNGWDGTGENEDEYLKRRIKEETIIKPVWVRDNPITPNPKVAARRKSRLLAKYGR